MSAKTAKRNFFAMRIDNDLERRVEAVAKQSRSNPRIIVEQCIDAHLPKLEKLAGIAPQEQSPPKPPPELVKKWRLKEKAYRAALKTRPPEKNGICMELDDFKSEDPDPPYDFRWQPAVEETRSEHTSFEKKDAENLAFAQTLAGLPATVPHEPSKPVSGPKRAARAKSSRQSGG